MSKRPFVIISHQLPQAWLVTVAEHCDLLIGPATEDSAELSAECIAALPQADGLLTLLTVQVDQSLLAQAPKLRVISQMAVGVDNIDLVACRARGIPVGHTPGVLSDATADIAMGLLLNVARDIHGASADARAGKWGTWSPTAWMGMELRGATLGIIGLGAIGAATAERAAAFGMQIVYHNRQRNLAQEAAIGATYLSLEQLLRSSDVVSLHVPLSAETHHLIDKTALALMQPHAILINTARGAVVNTADLTTALSERQIAAAGLDVTDPEPLAATHPLYQLDNCLITPHIGSATHHTRRRMAELACQNLLAGLNHQPLLHQAN